MLFDQSEPTTRDACSTAAAAAMTPLSGRARAVPGSAQRGSCFAHHPFRGGPVARSRDRYAERVSAAAAQSRGMAATPRGVKRGDDPPLLSVRGVLVGVPPGSGVLDEGEDEPPAPPTLLSSPAVP